MRYFFILLVGLFCLASYDSQSKEADGQTDTNTELESVLQKKAVAGDANAQYNLGVSYANGEGVPEDDREAVKWYRKAAEQGHANAQNNLGVSYATGKGVPQDFVDAYVWFNIVAAQGNKKAIKVRDLCKKNSWIALLLQKRRSVRKSTLKNTLCRSSKAPFSILAPKTSV